MVDKQKMVVFDHEGSFIVPRDAPELRQIRKLLVSAQGRIPLHRERGVFIMRTWQPRQVGLDQGFTWQDDA